MAYVGALGATGASASASFTRDIPFEMALTNFQIGVAKAVGDVLKRVGDISFMSKGAAKEWGTNMNNYAASVVQSILKKNAAGVPMYASNPTKAAKLLGEAAAWAEAEAAEYTAGAQELLTVSANAKQAARTLAKAAGNAVAHAGAAAAEGMAQAIQEAFERARKEGVKSLLFMLGGLALIGGGLWFFFGRRL